MCVCVRACVCVTALIFPPHRIMVLSEGRIAEFDTPNQLITKKGIFYGMAKDAGLV